MWECDDSIRYVLLVCTDMHDEGSTSTPYLYYKDGRPPEQVYS
jgi:hypothetical protein